MPELTEMEKPKTAGFVDRGYPHAKKQKRMEEEEQEIARLRTPKFKQQTIPNKKKPQRKRKHKKMIQS